ncbi:MAG: hypothetical protein OXH85_07960 [Truepera sp.]|nr:hypothetical protein [Truepera sp.]
MNPSRQHTVAISCGDYRWGTDRASTELLGRLWVRALEVGHSSGEGA